MVALSRRERPPMAGKPQPAQEGRLPVLQRTPRVPIEFACCGRSCSRPTMGHRQKWQADRGGRYGRLEPACLVEMPEGARSQLANARPYARYHRARLPVLQRSRRQPQQFSRRPQAGGRPRMGPEAQWCADAMGREARLRCARVVAVPKRSPACLARQDRHAQRGERLPALRRTSGIGRPFARRLLSEGSGAVAFEAQRHVDTVGCHPLLDTSSLVEMPERTGSRMGRACPQEKQGAGRLSVLRERPDLDHKLPRHAFSGGGALLASDAERRHQPPRRHRIHEQEILVDLHARPRLAGNRGQSNEHALGVSLLQRSPPGRNGPEIPALGSSAVGVSVTVGDVLRARVRRVSTELRGARYAIRTSTGTQAASL